MDADSNPLAFPNDPKHHALAKRRIHLNNDPIVLANTALAQFEKRSSSAILAF